MRIQDLSTDSQIYLTNLLRSLNKTLLACDDMELDVRAHIKATVSLSTGVTVTLATDGPLVRLIDVEEDTE